MANIQFESSKARRWPLVIALSLGVLGGAAADAVVTLRQASSTASQAALAAVPATAANLPAAAIGTAAITDAAVQEEAAACSCVDGAEVAAERSPLAPRRKHGRPSGHSAPVRTSLCAATAVVQQ